MIFHLIKTPRANFINDVLLLETDSFNILLEIANSCFVVSYLVMKSRLLPLEGRISSWSFSFRECMMALRRLRMFLIIRAVLRCITEILLAYSCQLGGFETFSGFIWAFITHSFLVRTDRLRR